MLGGGKLDEQVIRNFLGFGYLAAVSDTLEFYLFIFKYGTGYHIYPKSSYDEIKESRSVFRYS